MPVDLRAYPSLAQRLLPARAGRLADLIAQSIIADKPLRVRRLLRCKPDLSMGAWVDLARGLHKHWLVDTPAAKLARKGMEIPHKQCWMSLLEIAMLMPDPDPEVIEPLLDANTKITPLVVETAACHMVRILHGGISGPRSGVSNIAPAARWQRAQHIVQALNARSVEWDDVLINSPELGQLSARDMITWATREAAKDARWGEVIEPKRKHLQIS